MLGLCVHFLFVYANRNQCQVQAPAFVSCSPNTSVLLQVTNAGANRPGY